MAVKVLLFDLFGVLLVKSQPTSSWVVNQTLVAWLQEIKKQNKYQVGLVSNTSRSTVERFLEQANLRLDFFGIEVLSGEEYFAKPDRRFFQLALQRAKIAPKESLLIDDSKANILVAQTLGMSVLWVKEKEEIVAKIEEILKEK